MLCFQHENRSQKRILFFFPPPSVVIWFCQNQAISMKHFNINKTGCSPGRLPKPTFIISALSWLTLPAEPERFKHGPSGISDRAVLSVYMTCIFICNKQMVPAPDYWTFFLSLNREQLPIRCLQLVYATGKQKNIFSGL